MHYNNNPNLKASGVNLNYSEEQIKEYVKCSKDPIYFIENYCKVVSLDKGIVPFILYPYQIRMIEAIHNNKNTIGRLFRQAGKSTILAGYITWYIIFNESKTAAILANKQAIAKEIFSRVQFMIENLPIWLQQGVKEWNKTSLTLENGSRCLAAASSASAVRGFSISMLVLDEYAHLHPNLAEEFSASVFPTISSAESSKLAIISTPNGLNHYYKLWTDAENGINDFKTVTGHWSEHPERNQEWADKQKSALGDIKYAQEVEVSFVGSSYTLIDGYKLSSIPIQPTILEKDGLELYKKPIINNKYVISIDVSRGRHLDYSAFSIIDITKMPYEVVGIYKNNTISTLEFPHLIYNTARQYNDAFILIEINDLGESVSNTLWYEYEYENLYFSKGNQLSQSSGYPGIRTTSKVKSLGCSVLKELIEKDQLKINSFKIIEELGVFALKNKSYAAQDNNINDDLCTTLWLFAWLSKQEIFQELTDINLRKILTERSQEYINNTMTPFGFFDSGKKENYDSSELPVKGQYHLTQEQIELLKI